MPHADTVRKRQLKRRACAGGGGMSNSCHSLRKSVAAPLGKCWQQNGTDSTLRLADMHTHKILLSNNISVEDQTQLLHLQIMLW